jgi:SPX domain protein involved in polyphosphate accumulation
MKIRTYIFGDGGITMFNTVVKTHEIACNADKLSRMFMHADRLNGSPEECDEVNQLILRISELLDSVSDDFEKLLDEMTEDVE